MLPATPTNARRLRYVPRDGIRAAVRQLVHHGAVTEAALTAALKRRHLWGESLPQVHTEVDVAVSLLLHRGELRRRVNGRLTSS